MNENILRFPRDLEASPRVETIRNYLQQSMRPVRPESEFTLAVTPLTLAVRRTLNAARMAGRLTRGMELAEKTLATEARGMANVDQKSDQKRGVRISRVIMISSDGSDRFYRQIERLLKLHGERLLVIELADTAAEQLGQNLYGAGSIVRLVMITHREAVVNVLTATQRSIEEYHRVSSEYRVLH